MKEDDTTKALTKVIARPHTYFLAKCTVVATEAAYMTVSGKKTAHLL